jgi:diphosphomevalonate decarboxylase
MTLSTKVLWNEPVIAESDGTLRIKWQSPSNIALVKYWGKYGIQLPANPSISMTLRQSVTTMELTARPAEPGQGQLKNFYFEGQSRPDFAKRFGTVISSLHSEFPFLTDFDLDIQSSNSFPHSAGIASSASGFSALALCLCSLESYKLQDLKDENNFLQKASLVSRLGSGSACRSIYGGFSVWGKTKNYPGSSNEFAIQVNENIHSEFTDLQDAVLLISTSPKAISSSKGHSLMKDHPYRQARINQANSNIQLLADALIQGDWESFIQVTESEALSLHALMMSSTPGFMLMEPNTIEVIQRINEFRKHRLLPVCFTLDAGPNIHLIYRSTDKEDIRNFIQNELAPFCQDGKWLDDAAGTGPKRLK